MDSAASAAAASLGCRAAVACTVDLAGSQGLVLYRRCFVVVAVLPARASVVVGGLALGGRIAVLVVVVPGLVGS